MKTTPEKEVVKLLGFVLPSSSFSGKVKAVGGYVRDEYTATIKGTEFSAKIYGKRSADNRKAKEAAAK